MPRKSVQAPEAGTPLSPKVMPVIKPQQPPATARGSVPVLSIPLAQASARGPSPIYGQTSPERSPSKPSIKRSGSPSGESTRAERSPSVTERARRVQLAGAAGPASPAVPAGPTTRDWTPGSLESGGSARSGGGKRLSKLKEKFPLLDGHRFFNFSPRRHGGDSTQSAAGDVPMPAAQRGHSNPAKAPTDAQRTTSPLTLPNRAVTLAGEYRNSSARAEKLPVTMVPEHRPSTVALAESSPARPSVNGSMEGRVVGAQGAAAPLKSSLKSTTRPSSAEESPMPLLQRAAPVMNNHVPAPSGPKKDSILKLGKGNNGTRELSTPTESLSVTASPAKTAEPSVANDAGRRRSSAKPPHIPQPEASNGKPIHPPPAGAPPSIESVPIIPGVKRLSTRKVIKEPPVAPSPDPRGSVVTKPGANLIQQMLPPVSLSKSPAAIISNQICEALRAMPDKHRDRVLAALFDEILRLTGDAQLRNQQVPLSARATKSTAAAVAAALDHVSEELDRPMKDSATALKNSVPALKAAVEVCRDVVTQDRQSAEALVSAMARYSRKKVRVAGGQNAEHTMGEIVDSGLAQLVAQALKTEPMINLNFPVDAFTILSDGLAVNATRTPVRNICLEERVPDAAERIMNNPKYPRDSKQAASEFEVHFASSSPSQKRQDEAAPDLPVLMKVVRRRVRNDNDRFVPTSSGRVDEGSEEDLADPAVDLVESMLQNKKDLKLICKQIENNSQALHDPDVATSFAELVSMVASKRRIKDIEEANAHELLLKFLKTHCDNPDVVGSCLDAFSAMCEDSAPMQLYVSKLVPPAVQCHAIADDPDAAWKYVDLLEDLVVYGEGDSVDQMATAKVLKDLDILEGAADPDDSLLFSAMEDIRKAIRHEDSALTLKEVYSILMARQYHDDTLNILHERTIRRLFNFVRRKIDLYATLQPITEGIFSFKGSEFMYGCMSLQLLSTVEDNHATFSRWEIPNQMLKCMATQTDEQMAHHAVLTAVEFARYPKLAEQFVETKSKRDLIVNMLARARTATENDVYNDVEDLVGPRVQLIERTAATRETYGDTKALNQLLETWNDYDYYFYGEIRVKNKDDLAKVFKVNRREKRRERRDQRLGRHEGEPRGSIKRRTSQFFAGGSPTDKNHASRRGSEASVSSLRNSPLDRRRSTVGIHQPAASPSSPLERRRSVVGGPAAVEDAPATGGIMRRASQFFGAKKAEANIPPGLMPAVGSIAQARRASAAAAQAAPSPQRRASFIGRRTSLVGRRGSQAGLGGRRGSQAAMAGLQQEPAKASALQRRASIGPPSGVDLRAAVRKLSVNSDSDDEKGGAKSVKSALTSHASSVSVLSMDYEFDFDPDHWQQQDEQFVPRMLEYVFKALRKVAAVPGLPELIEFNVPMRLVGLIADPETPPVAFADIIYLIGFFAASGSEHKDNLGEYEAVEKVCSLLKRAHKQQGAYVSEVVTNACLALATLCVVHLPNTRRFEKKKAQNIVVSTVLTRGQFNDAGSVNAASGLICNLCFKNEDMKKILGEAGACEALVSAMQSYHSISGDGTKTGSRSISSLFRAIGNLALNQENMERFLTAKIEEAYCSFLEQVDSDLNDSTLEAALRTLSNLVIEKDNMERFANVVVPFLSLLRREKTISTEVHRWAFLTLAGLCRLPKNAETFSTNDGIRTIISLLPYIESTPQLRASIIICLGIQTTCPKNIDNLIRNDIFELVAENLTDFLKAVESNRDGMAAIAADAKNRTMTAESQAKVILEYSQLPISCLRCCHRVLYNAWAAEVAINNGILELAQKALLVSEFQPMLTYEALRVILAITALTDEDRPTPDFAKEKDVKALQANWNQKKEDESKLRAKMRRNRADTKDASTLPKIEYNWGEEQLHLLIAGEAPVPESDGWYEDPCKPAWILTPGKQNIRPGPGLRVWEELGLTENLCQMVETLRVIGSNPNALRNIRLQRILLGFLCWVSCERICIPSLLRRLNVPIDPDTHEPVPVSEPKDDDDGDYEASPKGGIQRRRSVWDVLRRPKPSKTGAPTDGNPFGRHRKPDHTSVVDFVQRTLQNLWNDQDCVNLAFILLNNCVFMAFGNPTLCELIADVPLYRQVLEFCERRGQGAHAYWLMTLHNYKRFLQTEGKWAPYDDMDSEISDFEDMSSPTTGPSAPMSSPTTATMFESRMDGGGRTIRRKRIMTGDDLGLLETVAITTLPIDLTQWQVDPFPDGVQSLPVEKRKWLRDGGQAECVDEHGDRYLLLWKASHDLIVFEWKIVPPNTKIKQLKDIDPQYPNGLAVSRFLTIANGADHPWFMAAEKDRSFSESKCCYLRGPATPTQPQGVTICLRMKDSKERDAFVQTMSNWREACAFGFM